MNNTFSWRILRVGSLRECLDAWQQSLLYQQLDERLKMSSEIVLDELGSNFLRYSGAKAKEMLFTAEYANEELMLTFDDDGVAFDPTEAPDAPKGNIALLPVGGRGIHMVRRCVDAWNYRREENRNINILRKQLPLVEPEPEKDVLDEGMPVEPVVKPPPLPPEAFSPPDGQSGKN